MGINMVREGIDVSKNALGNFIRLKRLARGYRQEDVCFGGTVRFNIGHYCMIERGKVVPKLQTLQDIAEVLRFELQNVADKYLHVQTDLIELETLGRMWLEKGYIDHVYKIAYRMFSLAKSKGARSSKAYVATGLFLILCCRIKEKRRGSVSRMACELFRLINKEDIYPRMDELYRLSRDNMSYDVLIEIYRATNRPEKLSASEKFNLLYQYCSCLYFTGRYSEAQKAAKVTYDYRSGATKNGIIHLLLRWGNILIQQREYLAAINKYKECLEHLGLQDKDTYFGCLSNIARAYWKDKKPEQARSYWERSSR